MDKEFIAKLQQNLNFVFNRRNPFYAKMVKKWENYLAAYGGGEEYIEQALIKHISEIAEEFTERKQRAYYVNHPQKIAQQLTNFIFSEPPNRDNVDPELVEDWSRTGLKTNEVMRQFATYKTVLGIAWLIVDCPSFEGPKTKEDEIKEKLRPYCLALNPLDVVDWCYGADGKFDWVIVKEECFDNSDLLNEVKKIERRKLWTRNECYTIERIKTDTKLVSTLEHNLGVVPVIQSVDVDGYGLGVNHWFEDIVRISDAILNNESEAQMNTVKQTFPLLVVPAEFKKNVTSNKQSTEKGTNDVALAIARSAALTEDNLSKGITRYVSTSGVDTMTIRSEINHLGKLLFDQVGLALQKDTKMSESAESKTWDFHNIEQVLKSRVDTLEQSENLAWELFSLWQKELKTPVVSYNRNFAIMDLQSSIAALIELAGMNINSELYQKEINKTAVTLLGQLKRLPSETLEAIITELENSNAIQQLSLTDKGVDVDE